MRTETSHMLGFDVRAQLGFYRWVAACGVLVHELPIAVLERIMDLVEKYRDRPMNLADAMLVVVAETLGITEFPELPHRELPVPPFRFFQRVVDDTVWIVAVCRAQQRPEPPKAASPG